MVNLPGIPVVFVALGCLSCTTVNALEEEAIPILDSEGELKLKPGNKRLIIFLSSHDFAKENTRRNPPGVEN
jgi:hypothetical protein